MSIYKVVLATCFYFTLVMEFVTSQEQGYTPMRFAIEDRSVKLPCSIPGDATYLKWKFNRNGTTFDSDAAQVFPGNIPSIFKQFDSPKGRSELVEGSLVINEVLEMDEGYYWCEISTVHAPTAYSKKYPLHVYVTPQEPQVIGIGNSTITEYKNTTVARCSSSAGKPASSIHWYNGSQKISTPNDALFSPNAFKDYLTDGAVDLRINNPTRFDHERMFSCVVDHPAYEGTAKVLNYTIKVMYHPVNIRIWANHTSKYIYCEADGYPPPTYHWTMPGELTGFTAPFLYIEDLSTLPGYEYFKCTASNGILPNATAKVKVDDLAYPNGKPGFLGLDWWVWGCILGGVAALICIIVVIVCCVRHRKKASGRKQAGKYIKPTKRPITSGYDSPQRHATSLQVDVNYRTPDGREDSFDSRTPTPPNEYKQRMIDNMYSRSSENITLIPSGELRKSRENVFVDNRKSIHASMDQLHQAANHIATLNKSWDQLSKSKEQLNEAQNELHYASANVRKSREQLYHSQEALNRDDDRNYPYIDEGTTRSNENYTTQDAQYYYDQNEQYADEQREYDRQGYRDSAQEYDDRQEYDTYHNNARNDQSYGQGYDQGKETYGRSYGQDGGGRDQGYGYADEQQDYRYQDDRYRQDDGYQHHPARIV